PRADGALLVLARCAAWNTDRRPGRGKPDRREPPALAWPRGRRREAGNMSRAVEKVKEELLAVLPPTLFFFVSLHIVAVIRTLMARSTAYQASSTLGIGVAALILGKAVLIADLLPAINRFPDRPLVYNITWKTALYLLVATAIHFAERVVEVGLEAGDLPAGAGTD